MNTTNRYLVQQFSNGGRCLSTIRKNRKLTAYQKLFLFCLSARCRIGSNFDEEIRVSITQLADEMSVSLRTARKVKGELERLGYIYSIYEQGWRTTSFWLCDRCFEGSPGRSCSKSMQYVGDLYGGDRGRHEMPSSENDRHEVPGKGAQYAHQPDVGRHEVPGGRHEVPGGEAPDADKSNLPSKIRNSERERACAREGSLSQNSVSVDDVIAAYRSHVSPLVLASQKERRRIAGIIEGCGDKLTAEMLRRVAKRFSKRSDLPMRLVVFVDRFEEIFAEVWKDISRMIVADVEEVI